MRLASEGISTGIHYPIPCHLQPAFAAKTDRRFRSRSARPSEVLSLPMYPHLGDAEIGFIADAIDRALADREPIRALAS